MIMTVAGTLFPLRAATVSGLLTAAGVVGSVVYPPLMGLVSGLTGLGAGMTGAAVLALLSGAAVVTAGRVAARRRRLVVGAGAVVEGRRRGGGGAQVHP